MNGQVGIIFEFRWPGRISVFENLTERLDQIFQNLRRRGKLSEEDVDVVMREVRMALLEADVHYSVVKGFVARVRERSVGQEVSKALNPAQQVVKIVHEELIATLGEPARLNLTGQRPRVILLVGLQGSGKTTAAAKLARILRSQGERLMIVAADPYRPAAVKQLQTLGEKVGVQVFHEPGVKPPELVARAFEQGQKGGFSVIIADTAGRSQLDQQLMDELKAINGRIPVADILLVVELDDWARSAACCRRIPRYDPVDWLDNDQNGRRFAWRCGDLNSQCDGRSDQISGNRRRLGCVGSI